MVFRSKSRGKERASEEDHRDGRVLCRVFIVSSVAAVLSTYAIYGALFPFDTDKPISTDRHHELVTVDQPSRDSSSYSSLHTL